MEAKKGILPHGCRAEVHGVPATFQCGNKKILAQDAKIPREAGHGGVGKGDRRGELGKRLG